MKKYTFDWKMNGKEIKSAKNKAAITKFQAYQVLSFDEIEIFLNNAMANEEYESAAFFQEMIELKKGMALN